MYWLCYKNRDTNTDSDFNAYIADTNDTDTDTDNDNDSDDKNISNDDYHLVASRLKEYSIKCSM